MSRTSTSSESVIRLNSKLSFLKQGRPTICLLRPSVCLSVCPVWNQNLINFSVCPAWIEGMRREEKRREKKRKEEWTSNKKRSLVPIINISYTSSMMKSISFKYFKKLKVIPSRLSTSRNVQYLILKPWKIHKFIFSKFYWIT